MTEFELPYGTSTQKIETTSRCDVRIATLHHLNAVENPGLEVERAVENPYSSEPLQSVVSGDDSTVIIVEDLARPTQTTSWILPVLIRRLKEAGIRKRSLRAVVAVGAHEAQKLDALDAKVGRGLLASLDTSIHNCLDKENLEFLGTTTYATPVWINRVVVEAKVKIGIGNIRPHPWAGYTGGGKIIMPGVSAWESIGHNHFLAVNERSGLGILKDNPVRDDADQCARKAGLSYIVNTVINAQGKLVRAFSGNFIEAHRKGTYVAESIYGNKLEQRADIIIAASGPYDSTLWSCFNSGVLLKQSEQILKKDGTIVILGECSQGLNSANDGHLHYDSTNSDAEMLPILKSGTSPQEILSDAKRYNISYLELAAKGYLLAKMVSEKNIYVVTKLEAGEVKWLGRKISSAQEAFKEALKQEGSDARVAILAKDSLLGAYFSEIETS